MSDLAKMIVFCVVIVPPFVWRLLLLPTSRFKAYATAKGSVDHIAQNPGKAGIAISKARGEIYLMTCYPLLALLAGNGVMKTYRFNEVRNWTINDVKAEQVYASGGVFQGINAVSTNASLRSKAMEDSGLFVTVRDTERPEWQIWMKREEQKKWFEILQQAINEG